MLTVLTSGPLLAASVLAWSGQVPDSTPAQGGVGPGVVGQWDPPMEWPVIAIHAALLNTGKVLHYSYPGGGPGSRAELFDPETGASDASALANTPLVPPRQSTLRHRPMGMEGSAPTGPK